jgi:hypothetical protein
VLNLPDRTGELLAETLSVLRCPVCGNRERRVIFEGYDHLHDKPGRFPVARCLNCETVYLMRRPAALGLYYPADAYAAYDGAASRHHFSWAWWRNYGLAQRQRLIQALKPKGGRLLDIGCGAGDFLSVMQSAQWRCGRGRCHA